MKDLQKKFDDYKKKVHTKEGIGEFYERQIRYLYEKNGWRVEPYGILKGKKKNFLPLLLILHLIIGKFLSSLIFLC